ncbi:50S ribosomal protein L29 [Patescibacteria group bacterium]|nr:MAG: 50S ribosomal protein L29 [Patescibacteria group bacterium]
MKIKEIRSLGEVELKKLIEERREKVLGLRFDISSKQVKDHRDIREFRRDIAKIETVLRELNQTHKS